ncbi:MAG: polyprenyl synthetase family protein [Planctomycetes bacterium]|nr:polyprenyl synthetase family protein [Planctomycetota bacterium]
MTPVPQSRTLADVLREKAETVRGALDRALAPPDEPSRDLYEAMRYMALGGGKKLRPVLVLLAAEACGGSAEAAMPAACAVEMVHTYSLIHDDLPAMDNDDLRHGRPSCHKAFGEALAILAGDGLLTEAFAVLGSQVADAARCRRLTAELASAAGAVGMVGGQAADLRAERQGLADERLLEVIHRRKTARMIEAAAVMGAIAAGASEHYERSLRAYGTHLGLAFQIADDVLDAEATTEALGKTAGKDAAAGKLTFVRCYGVAAARQRALVEADRAVAALSAFGHEGDWLRDLARFVVQRTF